MCTFDKCKRKEPAYDTLRAEMGVVMASTTTFAINIGALDLDILKITRKGEKIFRKPRRTMQYTIIFLLLIAGLFAGILILLEFGRKIGVRRRAADPEGASAGIGAVEGAVFGLTGLLIAFTFSGAAERFEARRHLIVEEANAIGTAYLRLDMLPNETQPALRDKFRQYVDSRLAVYRKLPDIEAAKAELVRSTGLQGEIWTLAVKACRQAGSPAVTTLVLSSLNDMIDITTTRTTALRTHPPVIIFVMLAFLVLIGSMLVGYGMSAAKTKNWISILTYAIVTTTAIYIIVDFEFPRAGLIGITSVDQVLMDVRASIK